MKSLLIIMMFLVVSLAGYAQASLKITVTPDSIRIGDPVQYKWSCTLPNGAQNIILPALPDSFSNGIEVIRQGSIYRSNDRNGYLYTQMSTITAYDSGHFILPPVRASFTTEKGDTEILISDTSFFCAALVPVDTTKAIKDVKDIYEIESPQNFEWIYWIAIAIAVVLMAVFIRRRLKAAKPARLYEEPVLIDPLTGAMNKLNEMKTLQLWTIVPSKEFYTQLSNVLRIYLIDAHHIQAAEMVTDEICFAAGQKFSPDQVIKLRSVLLQADMAKFAKFRPSADQAVSAIDDALVFLSTFVEKQPHAII